MPRAPRGPRWWRRKRARWAAGGALAALVAGAAALFLPLSSPGAGGDTPRALTPGESERMALARYRTYRHSPSQVTVRAAVPGGTAVVRAVVDHRLHRAVGWYDAETQQLIAWDLGGLAVAPASGPVSSAAQAAREAGRKGPDDWTRRGFGPAPLDTALRLTLALTADRPDNAQLLAQAGPRMLREERINGRRFDVLSGPRPRRQASSTAHPADASPLTYWIGDDGTLRRVRADLGTDRTVVVDLTPAPVRVGVPGTPWEGS